MWCRLRRRLQPITVRRLIMGRHRGVLAGTVIVDGCMVRHSTQERVISTPRMAVGTSANSNFGTVAQYREIAPRT